MQTPSTCGAVLWRVLQDIVRRSGEERYGLVDSVKQTRYVRRLREARRRWMEADTSLADEPSRPAPDTHPG